MHPASYLVLTLGVSFHSSSECLGGPLPSGLLNAERILEENPMLLTVVLGDSFED